MGYNTDNLTKYITPLEVSREINFWFCGSFLYKKLAYIGVFLSDLLDIMQQRLYNIIELL